MIVIVIMGLVYLIGISSFDKISKKEASKTVSLKNLKEFLRSFDFEDNVRVVCYNNCFRCKVIVDDSTQIDIDTFVSKNIKVYVYDTRLGINEYTNETFFDKNNVEQDVCFSYRLFKNGVGEQLLVEDNNKVYD